MAVANRALAATRSLIASGYFLWAFVLFSLAVWIIWSLGNFEFLFDIIGGVVSWYGVTYVRKGCEELVLNRPEKPTDPRGRSQR